MVDERRQVGRHGAPQGGLPAEHERLAPGDPRTEVVAVEAVAADGSTLALSAEVATLPPWRLRVSGAGLRPLEACADDLFEALAAVRRALEPQGVRLMCQGARRDDRVDVFGPLAPDERARVTTVDEQAEVRRRWAASIAALPDRGPAGPAAGAAGRTGVRS